MAQIFEHGGTLLMVLLSLNVVGIGMILWKSFDMISFYKNRNLHLDKFTSFCERYQHPQLTFAEKVNVALDHYMAKYRSGLNTIKIIAAIAPLLGLLGTVIGIYDTFGRITAGGELDARVFATGISYALITTVGGLLVAIPHYMAHSYLSNMTTKAERKLEALYLTEK